MLIYKRLVEGWSERVENVSKLFCDECGHGLWINPDGEPYCDKVHEKFKQVI